MKQDGAPDMTAQLAQLGIASEVANTGSNCWAASIRLSVWDRLEVANPAGCWSWAIMRGDEQHMAGDWPDCNTRAAAKNVRRLIRGLGAIAA
ncbi:hypothetical protein AB0M39_34615 [Streptomyces sp. NPDC051907]|uniref:hypothetical protein n=1 Tax=Streptomyces sp. NPDC051907 TaxID=3155284 RepID=UPI0034496CA6